MKDRQHAEDSVCGKVTEKIDEKEEKEVSYEVRQWKER